MVTSPRSTSSIQVVVRLRPMNESEKKHGTLPVVTASTQDRTVTVIKGQGSRQVRSCFNFDRVFTAFSSQEEVFEETLKPVIGDVMRGYESTVFAYGQTGTGKTHTMEGDLSSPEMQGVIPRSAQAIFESLKHPQYSDAKVHCTYLEIYNEDLSDLLMEDGTKNERTKGSSKLEIMDGKKGTFCRGLTQKSVKSAEDVLALMQKAQNQRRIGETKMNKHSSRSHCIFTISVQANAQLQDSSGSIDFTGKLHLVDLAGSECAKTASIDKGSSQHSEIARERERMNINRSLLTLGRVISSLKEQSTSRKGNIRIPYRDSKLTRILQESLGGRCKTVVIATLSPSITAIEESISTLNYAQSANGIVNKPVATSYMNVNPGGGSKSALSSCGSGDNSPVDNSGNSIEYWHEMECRLQYMKAQVEESQAALARKHMQQQELIEKAEKAEAEKLECEKKISNLHEMVCAEIGARKRVESQLERTERTLHKTEESLRKTTVALKVTQETERCLTIEANDLIHKLKTSIAEGDALHQKVMLNYESDIKRRKDTEHFRKDLSAHVKTTLTMLSKLHSTSDEFLRSIKASSKENFSKENCSIEDVSSIIFKFKKNIDILVQAITTEIEGSNGIIPVLNRINAHVVSEIDDVMKIVDEGDDAIYQMCHSGLKNLEVNGNVLENHFQIQSENIAESLSSLKTNISTSQRSISKMISSAIEALSEVTKERNLLRVSHSTLLREWEDYSIKDAKNVKSICKKEGHNVSIALESLEKDSHCYNVIENALNDQDGFCKENGREYSQYISKQESEILHQKDCLVAANKKTSKLHNDCFQKIMSSFQKILKQQIQTLVNENDKTHKSMIEVNEKLQSNNKVLSVQTQQIVDKVEETSSCLTKHVTSAKKSGCLMTDKMKETKHSLQKLITASGHHREFVQNCADKAKSTLKSLADIEVADSNIRKQIETGGDHCSKHLSENTLENGITQSRQLSDNFEKTKTYVNDVLIRDCATGFSNIMEPRPKLLQSVRKKAEEIQSSISSSSEEIKMKSTHICNNTHDSASFVIECEQMLKNTVVKRREEMLKMEAQIDSQIDTLITETDSGLSHVVAQTEKNTKEIDEFAVNVIGVEKDLLPVQNREVLRFSEELTRTPSEYELENIDTSSRMSQSSTVDKTHLKENMKRHSSASDTLSIKSVCSMSSCLSPQSPVRGTRTRKLCVSPPSSPLRERNIKEDENISNILPHQQSGRRYRSSGSQSVKRPVLSRSISTPSLKSTRKKQRAPTPNRGSTKKLRTLSSTSK